MAEAGGCQMEAGGNRQAGGDGERGVERGAGGRWRGRKGVGAEGRH